MKRVFTEIEPLVTNALNITSNYKEADNMSIELNRSDMNNPSIILGNKPTINLVYNQDQEWSNLISDSLIIDPEGGEVTYDVRLSDGSKLPDWIKFDPVTRELSGQGSNDDVGDLDLVIVGFNAAGKEIGKRDMMLSIINKNDDPFAVGEIPEAALKLNEEWKLSAADYFDDPDLIHPGADSLEYSIVDAEFDTSWLTIDKVTGEIFGIPPAFGKYEFTIIATDEAGRTAEQAVTINVGNQPPVVVGDIDDLNSVQDKKFEYVFDVANLFEDPEGQAMTYEVVVVGSNNENEPLPKWLTFDANTFTLSGMPENADANQNYTFKLIATDSEGAQSSIDFNFSVENVNDAPESHGLLQNTEIAQDREDWVFALPDGAFTDIDIMHGDKLEYSAQMKNEKGELVDLPSWLTINKETGALSTTSPSKYGEYHIIVTATDSEGEWASDEFTLTVSTDGNGGKPNRAPEVNVEIVDQTGSQDSLVSIGIEDLFVDPDGDVLTYTVEMVDAAGNVHALPSWLTFDATSMTITGTPGNDDAEQNYTLRVTAKDPSDATATYDFNLFVENINDAPESQGLLQDTEIAQDREDWVFALPDGAFTDIDIMHGDKLEYSAQMKNEKGELVELPSWLTINKETGALSTTSPSKYGEYHIVITATDSEGESASDDFMLTVSLDGQGGHVNRPPTIEGSIDDLEGLQDKNFTYTFNVNELFNDPDGMDTLSYKVVQKGTNSLPSWLTFDESTLTLSGTPNNDQVGNYEFTIIASDSEFSASIDFNVGIGNVNDAPFTTGEVGDITIAKGTNWVEVVGDKFDDPDFIHGDKLTYSAQVKDANGNYVDLPTWLHIDSKTGAIYTTGSDIGEYDIRVIAEDTGGLTAHLDFKLTVTEHGAVNQAPNFTGDASNEVDEKQEWVYSLENSFTDPEGDSMTFEVTGLNGAPLPSWLRYDAATKSIIGTANNDEAEQTYQFEVIAIDEHNNRSEKQVIEVKVHNVNDAPVAEGTIKDVEIAQGKLWLHMMEKGTFTDVDIIHGDVLTYSLKMADNSEVPEWLHIDSKTGAIYTGGASLGEYGLIVVATDSHGASAETEFTLTVSENGPTPINHAPEFIGDAEPNIDEKQDWAYDLTQHFTDKDGDTMTFEVTDANGNPLPSWMTYDAVSKTIFGIPENDDAEQTYQIKVVAKDGKGGETEQIIDVHVNNVNDAPTAVGGIDNVEIAQSTSWVNIVADKFEDIDVIHGDFLTYSLKTADGSDVPSWIHIDSKTGAMYTNGGSIGEYNLVVVATDTHNESAEIGFTLTVSEHGPQPINHAPEFVGDAEQTIDEKEAWAYDLNQHFTDKDGDTMTFEVTDVNGDPLPSWMVYDPVSKTIIGTAGNDDAEQTYQIKVVAKDGKGGETEQIIDIHVNNVNDAPVANISMDDVELAQNTPWVYELPDNAFSDVDSIHGDTLTYRLEMKDGSSIPAWIHIDERSGAIFTSGGSIGDYNLVVVAEDTGGLTASIDFKLTISEHGPQNKPPVLNGGLVDQDTLEKDEYKFTLPNDLFLDPEGEKLTYEVVQADGSPLPSWLSFNPDTLVLSGVPGNDDVGFLNLKVIATDPAGGSNSIDFNIEIINVNDAPQAIGDIPPYEIAVDANNWVYELPAGSFYDPDMIHGDEELTFSAKLSNGDDLPSWLKIDSKTGALSGAGKNELGSYEIIITATDKAGESAHHTLVFDVTQYGPGGGNTPPEFIGDPEVEIDEKATWSYDLTQHFQDIDNDEMSFEVTLADGSPLPSWLTYDANTKTLVGKPQQEHVGNISLKILASDGKGAPTEQLLDLTIHNVNDAPEAHLTEFPAQDLTGGSKWVYLIPDGSFTDPDLDYGDKLTYSLRMKDGSEVPDWLRIDAKAGNLYGTPPKAGNGHYEVEVVATDTGGLEASIDITINVNAPNTAPEAHGDGFENDLTVGKNWVFYLPEGSFTDADEGDVLTYSLQNANGGPAPSWLKIDRIQGHIYGQPPVGVPEEMELVIIATDKAGATATLNLKLTMSGLKGEGFSIEILDSKKDVQSEIDLLAQASEDNAHALVSNDQSVQSLINAISSFGASDDGTSSGLTEEKGFGASQYFITTSSTM